MVPRTEERRRLGLTIHIHEDDWGLRTLHPLGAHTEVTDDLSAARAAGEANRAPDGLGWTDLYLIKTPSLGFAQADYPRLDPAMLAPDATPLDADVEWEGDGPVPRQPVGNEDPAPGIP